MITQLREKKETGFSLLELSVAVGVSAIVATAGIVATTAFIGSAQDKRDSYTDRANTSIEEAESASVALGLTPVVAPNNVTESNVSSAAATVTWDAPADPVDSYTILKDGDIVEEDVDAGTTSYTLTGLTSDTTYSIVVRSVGPGGTAETTIQVTTTAPAYSLASNGVTVLCPGVEPGETFTLDGTTYTKREAGDITGSNAATTCTTGITDMSNLFYNNQGFNANISHWDTSDVTDMSFMFYMNLSFNQDINNWDTSNVTNMAHMFRGVENRGDAFGGNGSDHTIAAWDVSNVTDMSYMFNNTDFNQDISGWCVEKIETKPYYFDNGAAYFNNDYKPVWGTCP